MKVGKFELIPIEAGRFGLDGGAMFGIVPKVLWERSNPADEKNRIELTTRCLLLKNDERRILIDTGVGEFWDDKFTSIYKIDHSKFNLLSELGKKGIEKEDVTDVILTHLHFDHTGGSVLKENEKFYPTFPNAKYFIQKKHFEWATNPCEKDQASFIGNRFIPLKEEGVLTQLEGEFEFDEGIQSIVINGHTFAQQMVKISDDDNTILYCADLLPFYSHILLPYIMAYDLAPLTTLKEKKIILESAAKNKWILFFEHDPEIMAATVSKTKSGYVVDETFSEL
ncbi:MBL fold metallo-hydrolase [Bacteroidota bacterium]